MRRTGVMGWWLAVAAFFLAACSSRPEGTCEKDSHCSGVQVCFEGKCMTMKELEKLKQDREEADKPKVCEDKDGDGSRVGNGCPTGEPQDCNDNDATVAPGKTEVCDEVDNDCDGMNNEGFKGCVQTLFGGATWGNSAENRLDAPRSVVFDPRGFTLVTDNHHVWKVTLDGQVSIFSGSHLSNFVDGPGADARFSYPAAIVPAGDGGYMVADCKNNCIRKLSADGTARGLAGYCSNLTKDTGQYADGAGSAVRFYCPVDLALTPDNAWIVVDRDNARIRRLGPDGTVSTLAGLGPVEIREGEGQDGYAEGPMPEARFNDPQAVLVDPKGIIYISESFNCRIRKIEPTKGEHGTVSTLAGESDTLLGVGGFQDGTGKGAKFSYPHGMIFDPAGNLIVADTGNSIIRKVTPAGKVTTLYGKPGVEKAIDGPIAEAGFATPTDLAWGPDGSLFVVDTAANRLRWIVP